LERFSGKFALIGKIEDQIRRFLDAIEQDDAKKQIRSMVVIDYDELEREIPIYRGGGTINNQEPFNLGFFMIPFIGRRGIRLVLTTTKKDISDIEVFSRFFTQVDIGDLSQSETLEKFTLFEADKAAPQQTKDALQYTQTILEETANLFAKNLPDESLLEVLNRYFEYLYSRRIKSAEALNTALLRTKDSLVRSLQGYIDDAALPVDLEQILHNEELIKLLRQLRALQKQLAESRPEAQKLTLETAFDFLTERYNLDKANLTVDEKNNLLELEEHLRKVIIGQDEPINALGDGVRIGKAGLKSPKKPIGTYLYTGPTGVGKTELPLRLSKELGIPLFRYDMTEFKKPEDVSKLIGAPPGYIGHADTENLLTTKIIKNPRCIIVFDEIDKILDVGLTKQGTYGITVLDILLQMLEDGRLTDSHGNTADFSQSIIFFTSNGGVNIVFTEGEEGMVATIDNSIYDEIKEAVLSENAEKLAEIKAKIKERVDTYHRYMLRPEFLNRIDNIVVFNPLAKQVLIKITKLLLSEFSSQMAEQFGLVFGENDEELNSVVEYLLSRGFSPEKGARGILGMITGLYTGSATAPTINRTQIGLS